ncbi:MAG TPA: energy transducer TonB [Vicinamibacteria bacterium]|nr:energy transducer TonB [Vicinamibacteria bacterium]
MLVRDLGLSVESRDQQAQVLTTKWQSLSRQRRNGLEPQSLEAGARAEEFQLNLFVSPFVEPARVYVDAVAQSRGARPRTWYAFEPVAVWFFDRLAERMGEEGRPVPVTWASGDERSNAQEGHPECTPSAAADGAKHGLDEPKRLVSRPPIFPGRDLGRSGTVLLEALIGADGAVQHLRVLDAPAETRMAVAAASAVNLWRYQPARLQGCPVPTSMKVTVNFHSEIGPTRIR